MWRTCTWCSSPTHELVFLLDGLHPQSCHVCLYHSGVLRWLGAVSDHEPTFLPAGGMRHWLDDQEPRVVAVVPWRVAEWGLAGLERPLLRRRVLMEQGQ